MLVAFVVVGIRIPAKAYAEVVGNLNSISTWAEICKGVVDGKMCNFIWFLHFILVSPFWIKNYCELSFSRPPYQ